MAATNSWYILQKVGGKVSQKGPFSSAALEEMARQGQIVETTAVAHPKHTNGRAIEARRVTRLYDIFSVAHENTQLIPSTTASLPPQHELANVPSNRDEVGIARFMADGQDPSMIVKLAERVDGICTQDEQALYMAVQQKPVANVSPDAMVLTNRRAIIFRQKVLGRLQFVDLLWLNVKDVHFSENVIGSTISIRGMNGQLDEISYLPKIQAKKIYRIAQEMEEKMVELRRERSMEESRAGAANIVVNNDLGNLASNLSPPTGNDDLEVLAKLKKMLEAGLIEQIEYDSKKRDILERM